MRSPRKPVIVGAVGILVVGLAAVTYFAWPRDTVEAEPVATAKPSASPTPVEIPSVVRARGSFSGWDLADMTDVAFAGPEITGSGTNGISVAIDAPVVDTPVAGASTRVAVATGQTYRVHAIMRLLEPTPTVVPASWVVGSTTFDVPDLTAEWEEVSFEFVADSDEATLSLVLDSGVSGLGIDDVTVRASGDSANLVSNGSFESVEASGVISNDSLLLPATQAQIALAVPPGATTWSVRDAAGATAREGSLESSSVLELIDLSDVEQGWYVLEVTDVAGVSTTASFAVIDRRSVPRLQDPRFGVGLHLELDRYTDAARAVREVGFGVARNDVLWDFNEKEPGVYRFDDRYTQEFAKLHVNGIGLLGIVNYGNPLYDRGGVPASEAALAAYGKYAAAVAQNFDVIGLEIYNEFNHERFNTSACGVRPECYVPLLRSAHDALASAGLDVPIVAGATANYDAEWFDGLWAAGGIDQSDAVSFHPYQVLFEPDSIAGVIDQAEASMQAITGQTRPVWITELGWTTNNTGVGVSVDDQAASLVRSQVSAIAAGAEKYFWYDLVNDTDDPAEHEGNFGLFVRANEHVVALQPKPSALAQALLIEHIGGRAFTRLEDAGNDVVSALFGPEASGVRVAWSPANTGVAVWESSVPVEIIGVDGSRTRISPEKGSVSVPLTSSPSMVRSVQAGE